MGNSKIDLNTIPYDAPLTFELPSREWIISHAKNRKSTTISISPVDLSGKWVIITGSNNGIGREAALQMAEWGANLILGCRNPPRHETHPEAVVEECKEKAKKAGKQIEVEWWELDMASLKSVEAFAKRWLDTRRALDILCNNAGMGSSPGGSEVFRTGDGFEIIHQVCLPYHPSKVMEMC
jgi:NAD(P)-dependent dehydrogenase (short-subunit alcohol dehydrogenase family)